MKYNIKIKGRSCETKIDATVNIDPHGEPDDLN